MPDGNDVIVPEPTLVTVRVWLFKVNDALTFLSPFMTSTQVPLPLQPLLQVPNAESLDGAGVSVTVEFCVKLPVHVVAVQVMPAGDEVMVPLPLPVRFTVIDLRPVSKLAVTTFTASMVTVQLPVPVQPPPDQPVKVEFDAGTSVSVTSVLTL
jgi:hypothetical protein